MKLIAVTLLSLATVGCAAGQNSQNDWPEQASPAYPTPGGQGATAPRQAADFDTAPDKSDAGDEDSQALAKRYEGKKPLRTLKGKATYYADSLAGNHTANGDVYDPQQYTAAHKKLPFGTVVRVVCLDSGKTTYVRINDRGPFGPADRIIDVSKAAAKQLGMMKAGVVAVRVEVVEQPAKK